MKLKFAAEALSKARTFLAPTIFTLKKHAPEILVGVGAASIVGGTVVTCKATLDAKDILTEELHVVEETEDENGVQWTMEDDLEFSELERKEALKLGLKVVKGYLPGVGLIGGGVAMMVAAKSIEHRRFTAMLGAYSTLQSMFEEYRGRVIAEAGPSLDYRAMRGTEMEKVSYSEKDEETGKTKKVKDEVVVYTAGENPYHRLFDEFNSPMEWQDNLEQNRFFLECQQTVLNQELNRHGRIFLSEVYKRLGFEYNEVGQFVGWLASDIEGSRDGFIDFGIDYGCIREEIERAQREGRRPEPSIWLNFNCDGEVWDKPLVKRRDQMVD